MGAAASLIVLAVVIAAAPAQSHASTRKPGVTKPTCSIGAIGYDNQTGRVFTTGRCFVSQGAGRKARTLRATWKFTWIGYDESGATFGSNREGSGKDSTFVLNPARFFTVKVTFTITSARSMDYPRISASKMQTIGMGGLGLVSQVLGSGRGATPPPMVNGVNPLCPFTDPSLDVAGQPKECGTAEPGSCAFVTPPTIAHDGTVQAGKWLCPTGKCVAVKPRGPYTWFGYNVFAVNGYRCGGRNKYVGGVGVATISLVNADGTGCTLHPDDNLAVVRFRPRPEWGGTVRVTFIEVTFDGSSNTLWPEEYETAQFELHGSQNGCTSSDWSIASVA